MKRVRQNNGILRSAIVEPTQQSVELAASANNHSKQLSASMQIESKQEFNLIEQDIAESCIQERQIVLPPMSSVINDDLIKENQLKYRKINDQRYDVIKIPTSFDFSAYEQELRVSYINYLNGNRKRPCDRKASLIAIVKEIFTGSQDVIPIQQEEEQKQDIQIRTNRLQPN